MNDVAGQTHRDITQEELAALCRDAMRTQGLNFDLLPIDRQAGAIAYAASLIAAMIAQGYGVTAPKDAAAKRTLIV